MYAVRGGLGVARPAAKSAVVVHEGGTVKKTILAIADLAL
jgi:hypothetical protein